ncbi:RNA methyltransferase [Candidatus Peregrinibacteria bacterium]|nr:RNA methyltransferase [Candidatus Peregrinibacteria bacterium]
MPIQKIPHSEIKKSKPSAGEVRLRKRTPVYVVLDGIRSMYNVGAMFRTSDAALVEKVFLTGITPKPPHKDIDKSALGAADVVPWQYVHSAVDVIKNLKSHGIKIIALELTKQSVPYHEMKYSFPVCLVVGNEVLGISDEVLNLCDFAIDIPMLGLANSLNVATAYGIALFEILRQHTGQ